MPQLGYKTMKNEVQSVRDNLIHFMVALRFSLVKVTTAWVLAVPRRAVMRY